MGLVKADVPPKKADEGVGKADVPPKQTDEDAGLTDAPPKQTDEDVDKGYPETLTSGDIPRARQAVGNIKSGMSTPVFILLA